MSRPTVSSYIAEVHWVLPPTRSIHSITSLKEVWGHWSYQPQADAASQNPDMPMQLSERDFMLDHLMLGHLSVEKLLCEISPLEIFAHS